jgi:hypothetical protein
VTPFECWGYYPIMQHQEKKILKNSKLRRKYNKYLASKCGTC